MEPPAGYTELLKQIVDIANANDVQMDGTMAPVKRIISENEVVFAVWQDETQPHGVGVHPVKGGQKLREILADGPSGATHRVSAIKCVDLNQALALEQSLGEQDSRH
jgi:hypothetical protein